MWTIRVAIARNIYPVNGLADFRISCLLTKLGIQYLVHTPPNLYSKIIKYRS